MSTDQIKQTVLSIHYLHFNTAAFEINAGPQASWCNLVIDCCAFILKGALILGSLRADFFLWQIDCLSSGNT